MCSKGSSLPVGDQEFRAGPGGLVFARAASRTPARVLPRTGRILVLASPAGFEGFFRHLAEAEDRAGAIGPDSYASASKKYGINLAGLASPASDFARVAAVHDGAQSATAWDEVRAPGPAAA